MLKSAFVICAAIALVQQSDAFKVVTIHKGVPASVPAVNTAALIQGAQSAVVSKLQLVQTLVGALIQQKTALKQNALNSIQTTMRGFNSQVSSLASSGQPLFVLRKQIYVGVPKLAPAAPDSTTSVDADATTTSD